MRFRPEQHLRRQADFDHVRGVGRRYDAGPFTLFYAPRRPAPESESTASAPPLAPKLALIPPPAPPLPSSASDPITGQSMIDNGIAPAVGSIDVRSGASAPSAVSVPPPPPARAGFVASRSAVGNAVARARAKRRLREAFRAHQTHFTPGLDFIFVARRSLNGLEPAALQERFSTLCRKLFPPRAA